MRLFTFNDKEISEEALYKELKFALNECINRKGSVHFYVSGGKSPAALFKRLSREKLDWSKVYVHLVDERILPSEHIDSNTRLVRENLLQNEAANAKFIPCLDESKLDDYDALSKAANANYAQPDVLILGMGEDAHTASIFPTASNLDELLDKSAQPAYYVVKSPNYDRISLNLSAILESGRVFLNISGASKYEVFLKAAKEPNKAYPISYVLSCKGACDVYYAK